MEKMKLDRFNIRCYAVCIHDNKILTMYEHYAGEKLIKLPGGGLEFGETTLECLKREFKEELDEEIEILGHFYTQETFVISKFRANEQLLTIYYRIELKNPEQLHILEEGIDNVRWIPLDGPNIFVLPVDRIVFEKAKKELLK